MRNMKVVLDDFVADTEKAQSHYSICHWDGNNMVTGDLYQSSKGNWYAYSPSQWGNMHRWVQLNEGEVLDYTRAFFSEEEDEEIIEEILKKLGVTTE